MHAPIRWLTHAENHTIMMDFLRIAHNAQYRFSVAQNARWDASGSLSRGADHRLDMSPIRMRKYSSLDLLSVCSKGEELLLRAHPFTFLPVLDILPVIMDSWLPSGTS